MRHIKVISLLIFFCTYSIIGYAQQKLTSEIRGRAEIQVQSNTSSLDTY